MKKYLFLLFLLLLKKSVNSDKNQDILLKLANKVEKDFTDEYKIFKKTGFRSQKHEETIDNFRSLSSLFGRKNEMEEMPKEKQDVTCLMCRAVVNTFLDYRRVEHYDSDQLLEEAIDLCLSLNIQPESTCEPIIRMHLPPILFIIDARPELTAKNMCGMILQSSNCGFVDLDYTIKIDEMKSGVELTEHIEIIDTESYRVLHLTDVHFDPRYTPGSNGSDITLFLILFLILYLLI